MEMWKRNLFICWLGAFATASALSQVAPILPLYIDHLGVHATADIELWSGIAFGCTTLALGLVSPLWGKLADQYGRKPMLLRASLGMAIIVSCMGFVQNVYELVGLRLLLGTIAGFNSGAITLIATQTPKERAGWALGTLSTGVVGGTLLGPLLGGYLAEATGFRNMFFVMGALLLLAFVLTLFFVKEKVVTNKKAVLSFQEVWQKLPDQRLLLSMFFTTFVLQVALFSIEPIITVYIDELSPGNDHLALIAGLVFAASGMASILAASSLGKLSDRIGAHKVILVALIAAGCLFVPQALVKNEWQLMLLRFLLGIATAALMPSINTLLKQNIPDEIAGRVFGYNQAAQFFGTFTGALAGGQIAAHFGIYYVFYLTSALLLMNAVWVYHNVFKPVSEELSAVPDH
ncbi:multidrug efflux MFS transporter [Propionispora hippei]|uniref:Predicted arabinose efflux permease, MFS family n=1 Tax=Propionispora hippei DSM 15287 TaxID=1123003 RepID=A0A1M6JDR0_9FIRM|nr:multidrug efflux MFS transporter [Propionispora hippei]SHJ44794.1 Predicted arabinose efflux permease, MFS family [Propionispora hippei DSM 15287]